MRSVLRHLPLSALLYATTMVAQPVMPEPSAEMVDADIDFCRLQRVFNDDFDNLSVQPWEIGTARWIAHTPWSGDFGDATFVDPSPHSPFTIENGILSITAAKDANGKWTSGLLASADSKGDGFGLQYGYVEARMKLPTGPGTWPAFWLNAIPEDGKTDETLEVDIIEYYGHARASYQAAYHVWSTDSARRTGDLTALPVPDGSLEADFHTYGAKITPDFITFYLDRKPMWQVPTPKSHRNRLMILVNLALGSGFSIEHTPNPTVMQIDYIRAYNFKDPTGDCETHD